MSRKETLKTLALAAAVGLVAALAGTPLCILILSVDGCQSMACELFAMRRPMADLGWCEDFFDLFR